ncbi:MAG: hypothetical protein WBX38_05135 [Candidatus Sulfotelmatobacter sp.]
MRKENLHVADEELLLLEDGALEAGSADRVRGHLRRCQRCEARLKELENTLSGFGKAHKKTWEAALQCGDGPRALLRARLAEVALKEREQAWLVNGWLPGSWRVIFQHRRAAIFAGAAIAILMLLTVGLRRNGERSQNTLAFVGREEPDLRLTPGATVPVTESEVCGGAAQRPISAVPVSLKRKVFEEYGVTQLQPDAYEVDYLITPELGGATDIRNLWPEPYQNTLWNAHVKDQLEDRLRQMVCRGDVDLSTAQRDISTDWIAAYRKYFHADKPVADNSSFNFSGFSLSHPRT